MSSEESYGTQKQNYYKHRLITPGTRPQNFIEPPLPYFSGRPGQNESPVPHGRQNVRTAETRSEVSCTEYTTSSHGSETRVYEYAEHKSGELRQGPGYPITDFQTPHISNPEHERIEPPPIGFRIPEHGDSNMNKVYTEDAYDDHQSLKPTETGTPVIEPCKYDESNMYPSLPDDHANESRSMTDYRRRESETDIDQPVVTQHEESERTPQEAVESDESIRLYHHRDSTTSQLQPTMREHYPFDVNLDAEALRKAMKGFGCDKAKVVSIICYRDNAQRQEIAKTYKELFGKDLVKDLKSELSGDLEDLIVGLMKPPVQYDAEQLHKAIAGLGTDERALIEILCSRTVSEIDAIKSTYKQLYGNELEKDVEGDTSGDFRRLLVSLCAAGRDESMYTDKLKANQDAWKLFRAGEQRRGTDASVFNSVFSSQNLAQLRLIFVEYEKVTKHTIQKAVKAEFGGDMCNALLAIVACAQNKSAFFAKCLHDSMAGLGTRDSDLIRLVISRSEIDLADIKEQFQLMYKKSLEEFIKGDCSGPYRDGLIALVRGN